MINWLLAAVAALFVLGCSSAPPQKDGIASAPIRVGLYKGSDSDQAPWWCDKEHTLIDWEAEKKAKKIPTEYVVIHHTAGSAGRTWQQLSDLQRERLYVPRFKPTIPDHSIPDGVPVQSGHFRELIAGPNKGTWVEVFYAYQWLIRKDGTTERLLNDNEVGWDTGNWDMNMRSVSICFDGDYTNQAPTDAQLKAAAKLIAGYKKQYKIKDILGHCDVKATICPGNWWKNGGKAKLLSFISQ